MRVGIVGFGVIGKRAADAVLRHPALHLVGIAVRSAGATVLARPQLPYFVAEPATAEILRTAGVEPRGSLDDLAAEVDVVVDCGPSRTGIGRLPHYQRSARRAVFCGGERDPALGPLVHPAYPSADRVGDASTLRLPSCNTTALARLVAALAPGSVVRIDVTVLRCATDTDKARKGIASGATIGATPSHHAADLTQIIPGLVADSAAVTLPMVHGHVVRADLELDRAGPSSRIAAALAAQPRIAVAPTGCAVDTARLRDRMADAGRPWDDRYEVVALVTPRPTGRRHTVWLALDNEAVTIPEMLDLLQLLDGAAPGASVRAVTDGVLGVGGVGGLLFGDASTQCCPPRRRRQSPFIALR